MPLVVTFQISALYLNMPIRDNENQWLINQQQSDSLHHRVYSTDFVIIQMFSGSQ